ncbi:hypothetical protein PT974_07337 [Cladobotryum mycophilum]|uniref:Uncharacterized protein n=1 Tax=Cladobotryum mycophilum TaxID=491253 RepID=A0ABR0SP69_9HYPO
MSSKHNKHDHTGRKFKASGSSSHPDSGAAHAFPSPGFLFVVNELVLDYEQAHANGHAVMDDWFNTVPPSHFTGYGDEIPSYVMRYRDGEVTVATNYQWYRAPPIPNYPREEGRLLLCGSELPDGYIIKYKAFAVFSCNPLLPIVVADGDPLTQCNLRQHPLLFFHPQNPSLRGISQAVTEDSLMENPSGGGVVKFVAGREPSWIPALVPETYRNPELNPEPPQSVGLAGELPIVIGLMAFSEPGDVRSRQNCVHEIFLGTGHHRGRWRGGRWHHSGAPVVTQPLQEMIPEAFSSPSSSIPRTLNSRRRRCFAKWNGVESLFRTTPES